MSVKPYEPAFTCTPQEESNNDVIQLNVFSEEPTGSSTESPPQDNDEQRRTTIKFASEDLESQQESPRRPKPNTRLEDSEDMTPLDKFSDQPMVIDCPNCKAKDVTTDTAAEAGTYSCLCCCGIFFVGGVLGCCLIPLYFRGCQDITHICPKCHTVIGKLDRMEGNGMEE
ncbi:cell death-inducing p53-target protein 1 homolog [Lineus longissimus]|uniref:cell death-inducing p53-target protein 1 homolog n=1 Tax=Lineus longissimus TaxID=88925 RepID=UPI00315D50D0